MCLLCAHVHATFGIHEEQAKGRIEMKRRDVGRERARKIDQSKSKREFCRVCHWPGILSTEK